MSDYYDQDGQPMTRDEWTAAFEDFAGRRVAIDRGDDHWVSTVWLGLDHGYGLGPPLIFETMVFTTGENEDVDTMRYSTRAEALAGHGVMVEKYLRRSATRVSGPGELHP